MANAGFIKSLAFKFLIVVNRLVLAGSQSYHLEAGSGHLLRMLSRNRLPSKLLPRSFLRKYPCRSASTFERNKPPSKQKPVHSACQVSKTKGPKPAFIQFHVPPIVRAKETKANPVGFNNFQSFKKPEVVRRGRCIDNSAALVNDVIPMAYTVEVVIACHEQEQVPEPVLGYDLLTAYYTYIADSCH